MHLEKASKDMRLDEEDKVKRSVAAAVLLEESKRVLPMGAEPSLAACLRRCGLRKESSAC